MKEFITKKSQTFRGLPYFVVESDNKVELWGKYIDEYINSFIGSEVKINGSIYKVLGLERHPLGILRVKERIGLICTLTTKNKL